MIIDKNRILNFALELESKDPQAGEGTGKSNVIPDQKVSQIFNTYITGNVGNIASGGSGFSQSSTINISQGNVGQLLEYLKSHGISEEDTQELKEAINTDGYISGEKERFGSKVSNWIGKMKTKSVSGLCEISTSTASK